MLFHKFIHPANCRFFDLEPFESQGGDSSCFKGLSEQQDSSKPELNIGLKATAYAGDILKLEWQSDRWEKKPFEVPALDFPKETVSLGESIFSLGSDGIQIGSSSQEKSSGNSFLKSSGNAFGLCGSAFIYQFKLAGDMNFFGMGEKLFELELSRKRTKFWNTDVFADFHWTHHEQHEPDPMYVSVPWLIVRRGDQYVGMLLDNPGCCFMDTGSSKSIEGFQEADNDPDASFMLGTENMAPSLVIINGPDLPSLLRKLQSLVGKTPLPPVWSLGYHQCRWGYESDSDLEFLDNKFDKHQIPCDGLWIDIDYMEGYRVFTISEQMFSDPKTTTRTLSENRRHVVPIIDPGVKKDPGYGVYDEGTKDGLFCMNPEGEPYVGLVWPGETVFPDFSLEKVRNWWADHVAKFTTAHGFSAYWIDMNDPSTGPVENNSMLFDQGKESHDTYHNLYANGMAKATREGLLKAKPEQRPFVLSRSGATGINRYSAVWTGDNHSNEHYLRRTIACSLNLAMSGVPFNAPDMGGFAHNCTGEMLCKWMKMGFLFPFCRNHSAKNTRSQEPWAFDDMTLDIVRHYIRMRYRLRPYLYHLFHEQASQGSAIMRPLFHDFADDKGLNLHTINDQFMMGPSIMQAPILNLVSKYRDVIFPDSQWYSWAGKTIIEGNQKTRINLGEYQTPVFAKVGSILPVGSYPDHASSEWRPTDVEMHVFVTEKTPEACGVYTADDGISFDYQNGKVSKLEMVAEKSGDKVSLKVNHRESGFGKMSPDFLFYEPISECSLSIDGEPEIALAITREKRFLFGTESDLYRCSKSRP